MEHVTGYDDYEEDFRSIAMRDYWNMAEEMLLEAIELYEPEENLMVNLPDYKCADGNGYSFLFDVRTGGAGESGGILLCYAGYF